MWADPGANHHVLQFDFEVDAADARIAAAMEHAGHDCDPAARAYALHLRDLEWQRLGVEPAAPAADVDAEIGRLAPLLGWAGRRPPRRPAVRCRGLRRGGPRCQLFECCARWQAPEVGRRLGEVKGHKASLLAAMAREATLRARSGHEDNAMAVYGRL